MQSKRRKKPVKKKKAPDKPPCNTLPQRTIQLSVYLATSTREQAENEVHDRTLDECEADRQEHDDQCHTGKCDKGDCAITYELGAAVVPPAPPGRALGLGLLLRRPRDPSLHL